VFVFSDPVNKHATKVSLQNRQFGPDTGCYKLGGLKQDKIRSGAILPSMRSNTRLTSNGARDHVNQPTVGIDGGCIRSQIYICSGVP